MEFVDEIMIKWFGIGGYWINTGIFSTFKFMGSPRIAAKYKRLRAIEVK